MSPTPLPFKLKGQYPRPLIPTPVQIFLMSCSLIVIATSAVAYSLGYKINWQTHHFQQTGIIALTSNISYQNVPVSISGVGNFTDFPVRAPLLFPGNYTIDIQKNGYQDWEWVSNLDPNKVLAATNIVLIKNPESMVEVPTTATSIEGGSTDGISVDENELSLNGVFLTRTDDNILGAQWYPDKDHIAFQAGDTLYLYDPNTGISEVLKDNLNKEQALQFGFSQGGRLLLFKRGDVIYSQELYNTQ